VTFFPRHARPSPAPEKGTTCGFVDEYRDPAAARALVARITELAADGHFKFMEICGGHTHTIYRHGIEHLLPTPSSWCTGRVARSV